MDNVTGIDKLKMNMISTQIRHLRNYVTTDENLYDTLQEAAETIEALSSELQEANIERSVEDHGRWIPCYERVPDDSNYIFLSFSNRSGKPLVGRYMRDDDGAGAFYIGDDEKPAVMKDMFVTAWMPMLLPKPYSDDE